MISTQQLEAFWQRYQSEGIPNGLSMQAFFSVNNVPYDCFERHVKQRTRCGNIQPNRAIMSLDAMMTMMIISIPPTHRQKTARNSKAWSQNNVLRISQKAAVVSIGTTRWEPQDGSHWDKAIFRLGHQGNQWREQGL